MPPGDGNETIPPSGIPGPDLGPDELPAGTFLGGYLIAGRIGKGGTGTVYIAIRSRDGRHAAVKVLNRDKVGVPAGVERFLREADLVNRIKHPNVIEIYETGLWAGGRPWFAMELLDGENLKRILERRGRMSPRDSFAVVQPVCVALDAAHAAGVIHRDLKTDNVVLTSDGRIKIVDFGIAKTIDAHAGLPALTTSGQTLGTPIAMAPEQIRGEPVDARTDVYALGVLVYTMLSGDPPFRGLWSEVVRQHLSEAPRPPGASPAVDAVVLRCLAKAPAERFPSMLAVLGAYRDAVFG